jgi:AcrR family transcriptional regulator
LECAVDVLEREGPPAVTARRVAALADTSTGALYEFFGDKAGLIRAVYFEGFAALRATLEAVRPGDDAGRYLVELLAASRRFAISRPTLFTVMYSRPFAEFSPDERDAEVGVAIYRLIVRAVRRWLRDVGSSIDAREAAHLLVAAHRGFVTSELGGLAGSSPRNVEARYQRGVEVLLTGIRCSTEGGRCGS